MAKGKILIVEDEEIVAEQLKIIFVRWGYEVLGSVATGRDAIIMAKELVPDLILMDIFLIGLPDGIDTVKAIHATNPIPVIYLTASQDPMTRQRADETKYHAFMNKPYRLSDLRATVEQVFV